MSTRSTFHPSFVWISSISARRTSVRGVGESLFVTVSSTTPNTVAEPPPIDCTYTDSTAVYNQQYQPPRAAPNVYPGQACRSIYGSGVGHVTQPGPVWLAYGSRIVG